MFRNILVPFDGSNRSVDALRKAAELARLCDAAVSILTVYRHQSLLEASFSMVRPSDPGSVDEAMRDHAREVVGHGKTVMAEEGIESVRAFARSGQPARTIVGFARDHGIDLIVIGARGMGSVEKYMLGSVSHKVTGLSSVPVLVV